MFAPSHCPDAGQARPICKRVPRGSGSAAKRRPGGPRGPESTPAPTSRRANLRRRRDTTVMPGDCPGTRPTDDAAAGRDAGPRRRGRPARPAVQLRVSGTLPATSEHGAWPTQNAARGPLGRDPGRARRRLVGKPRDVAGDAVVNVPERGQETPEVSWVHGWEATAARWHMQHWPEPLTLTVRTRRAQFQLAKIV